MPEETKTTTSDSNLMAALSYLWLLSVVMLLVKKEDAFVQFHAKQGLVLFIASVVLWVIPIIGWLLNIAVFIAVILGFIKALQGEKYEMPLVSDIAKKINL
jgi:uncharacterized membrane protein